MTEVSVGVIGLGFMGGRWARALHEHPAARVAVISDLREDLGRELADRYGAVYVADPLEAAARPGLDGVVVATPEDAHVAPALAAIDSDRVVAVEKPLAHTFADAELVRDRAGERGVPVLAGHILRFEPRYAAIHRAIQSGEIGAVQAVRSERIGMVSDQEILRGRTTIALYYGVHELDLARWYGGEVARLYAERSVGVLTGHGYDVEDLYSATLRFVAGAQGTVMVGWSLPRATPGWGIAGFTVIGEEGVLHVRQGESGFMKVTKEGLVDEDVLYSPEVAGHLYGALGIEVDHFVRCVQGSSEPLCTATDGAEAVRLALTMERSADMGRPVEMGVD